MGAFDSKVVLITGAGSGIGRASAVRLARDGANVCVVDIDEAGAGDTASSVREFGRDAIVVRANVASKAQVQEGQIAARRNSAASTSRSPTPGSPAAVPCWTSMCAFDEFPF